MKISLACMQLLNLVNVLIKGKVIEIYCVNMRFCYSYCFSFNFKACFTFYMILIYNFNVTRCYTHRQTSLQQFKHYSRHKNNQLLRVQQLEENICVLWGQEEKRRINMLIWSSLIFYR